MLRLRLCSLHESQLSLLLWSDEISAPVYLSWQQTSYGRYTDFVLITSLNQWWVFFFFFAFLITHPRYNDSHRPEVCSKKNLRRKCSYSEPKWEKELLMVTVGSVLFFFLSFTFLSTSVTSDCYGGGGNRNLSGGQAVALTQREGKFYLWPQELQFQKHELKLHGLASLSLWLSIDLDIITGSAQESRKYKGISPSKAERVGQSQRRKNSRKISFKIV